jgi:hypothetical protein
MMIKNITLVLAIFGFLCSCENDGKGPSSATATAETEQSTSKVPTTNDDSGLTIHEVGVLRMSLPKAYEQIYSVQDLQKLFDEEVQDIKKADPGLFNVIVDNIGLNRKFYFDTKSDKKLNYVYFDEVGPRFPLNESTIEAFISMYEKNNKAQYASQKYSFERLDQKTMKVWGNQILKFRHKHSLGNTEWFTNQYLIFFEQDRRSLIVIEHDYNGGKTDLEKYITTVY